MEFITAHSFGDVERTEDIEIDENITFEEMYLSEPVLRGLNACGFVRPSPIQLSAIPLGRCGLDLIVQAKSGTGKTCVFSVVALEMISVIAKTTQVLVIAPTREIAVQIGQVMNSIGSSMPQLKISTFIGGTNVEDDKAKLKCCHIAIGTPGRLNQLVALGSLKLNNVRLLILDEADQLLTGQFRSCIMELVKSSPLNKQVLALSATYPPDVTEFLDKFMRCPSHVRMGKESPALIGVLQFVRVVPDHPLLHQRQKTKFNELLSLLSTVSFNQCLVFSNSQLRAESICNQLKNCGWPASFLTGGQMQQDRLEAFFALCSYKCRILVSTDLAARGIDSEHVDLVINLDIPTDQATYLHRVGRAGRFGSKGIAVSFSCEGEEWKTMNAIATLAKVTVRILNEDYDASTFEYEKDAEVIEPMEQENCVLWLEKQNKKKGRYALKKDNKEHISKQICRTNKPNIILPSSDLNENGNAPEALESPKKIRTVDVNDIIEKGKAVITEYSRERECHSFTHDDVLHKILEEWDTFSMYDTPNLKESAYIKDYPSATKMEHLKSYITHREAQANNKNLNVILAKSNKTFSTVLEDLTKFTQGISVANNYEMEIQDKSRLQLKDHENGSNVEEDLETYPGDKEESSNIDVIPKVEEMNKDVSCKDTMGVQSKEQVNNVRQKEYAITTGYGNWVTVAPDLTGKNKTSKLKMQAENGTSDPKSAQRKSKKKVTAMLHYSSDYCKNSDTESQSSLSSTSSYDSYDQYQRYSNSIDHYIRSAQKFGEMMEYVRSVGRMSSWLAHHHNQRTTKNKIKKEDK